MSKWSSSIVGGLALAFAVAPGALGAQAPLLAVGRAVAPASPDSAAAPAEPDSVPARPASGEDKAPSAVEAGVGTVRFGGLIQAWYSAGTGDEVSTFLLRRAELKFSGDLVPGTGWTLMVDAAKVLKVKSRYAQVGDTRVVTEEEVSQSSHLLQDAYVTLRLGPVELDAGQFKLPLSHEGGPQSNGKLETVERALFIARGKYGSARDLGMMLTAQPTPRVDLHLGLFNGVGETQNGVDSDGRKVVAGRAALRTPVEGLQVGASGAWSGPESNEVERSDRVGAELLFRRGPLHLKGEVMRGEDGDVGRLGYYAHAGYRRGALEGVLRYDAWDGDLSRDAAGADVSERDYLAGLNYYLAGGSAKVQANLVHRSFGGGLPSRRLLLVNVQTGW